MANTFESLIKGLKVKMDAVKSSSNDLNNSLSSLLTSIGNGTTPPELSAKDVITAFQSQDTYTNSIPSLLDSLSKLPNIPGTLETLTTATNIVQIYFQITQPLDQILSELVPNLEGLPSTPNKITITSIKDKINKLIEDRKNLQKEQNKILQEFEGEIDEQELQGLLRRSSEILGELKAITPLEDSTGNNPDLKSLNDLLNATDDFIKHLQASQELFKTLRRQGESLRDSEAGEVEQLIRNWRDTIQEIERLELNNVIRGLLNQYPDKSRQAIAQSIQIHELLEANYSFLSDLIRSGDLVSPGIL
jgi:hypothetical protein